ncbi:MAG: putative SAM-dependent methyltransferase [Paraglaciecola sp.]|jgi:predicted SAM-dependent methyltransferase
MYQTVKNILKAVVPKSFLQENEAWLRRIPASIFYRGNQHQCNVCAHHFSKFIVLENGDKLCPFCGSISRNRLLWKILSEEMTLQGRILHFSPSRPLFRKLKKMTAIEYISTDYEDEFLADKKLDITQIKEPDERFDYIICYHVLEHIIEDGKAMRELFRVLKRGGTIIIQTPFKEGDIYEDWSITSKVDRSKYFDQEDHVRVYSANGLAERLQSAGFQVNIRCFEEKDAANFHGLKKEETVLICRKR